MIRKPSRRLVEASNRIKSAVRELDLPANQTCDNCDPSVGFLCPLCSLIIDAGDLARFILALDGIEDGILDVASLIKDSDDGTKSADLLSGL